MTRLHEELTGSFQSHSDPVMITSRQVQLTSCQLELR
jgi:hypothetical protein